MQSMDSEKIKKLEEIIKINSSRIINIHYKKNNVDYTSPRYYIIPCTNSQLKKLPPSNPKHIQTCSYLNRNNKPIYGKYFPINIKDIYWIEVLDYPLFHKDEGLPLSDIVEVYFKHTLNKHKITMLFKLENIENEKNIEKSLKKIEKMTNSRYPSLEFKYKLNLVVFDNIGKI